MAARRTLSTTLARTATPLLLAFGLLALVVLSALAGDQILDRTVTEMLIRIVLVVGMFMFIGNSGVFSFGHIGFAAIGAYATAWMTCCPAAKPFFMPGLPEVLLYSTVPLLPAALLGGLLGALVALLIGLALMRLSGLAASIGTFAFLAIINVSYSNWDSLTAGTSSLIGVPVYVDGWVALAWAVLAIVVAHLHKTSRWGLMLRASREDEAAAGAAGIKVLPVRLLAFVLSAFFSSIAGVLYAHFLGILAVSNFYLSLTFMTLAMLVVGGVGSLSGAVIGVVLVTVVSEALRQLEKGVEVGTVAIQISSGFQEIALGAIMLLILIFRQGGIMGDRELGMWTLCSGRSRARTTRAAIEPDQMPRPSLEVDASQNTP